ncbi:MAG: ATP-binding protein [Acetobacteraceae bacterium]|nr:ATP-binding protein [Acetobacteraceae bacterium]
MRDTIGRRFALTIALAAAITIGLNGLFAEFAGVWSRPPLEQSGLPQQAGTLLRAIEAAPAEARPAIADAASSSDLQVNWDTAASPVAAMLVDTAAHEDAAHIEALHHLPGFRAIDRQRRVVYFSTKEPAPPGSAVLHGMPDRPYPHILAIELDDASWAVFFVPNRTWGLSRPIRIAIALAFLIVSIACVSALAAYQLSRPIRNFATALRRFGTDPRASSIAEAGPQELRDAVRAFNAMQAQIQTFVDDRTAMLAAISHDLRTPLTKMRLRGEFVENEAQQAGFFRDVDDMRAMIDSALSFFRDEVQDEETTTFDFPELLRTIADDYSDQGSEIAYSGPEHATFRGRPFALKRAFTNLVDNAVKYGGAPEIEFQCMTGNLCVLVRDKGPGIPPEMAERVFAPFYRLERSRNRATGGVGLGLTSARAVIRGHGGAIALRNVPSGGLEVEVHLPIVLE